MKEKFRTEKFNPWNIALAWIWVIIIFVFYGFWLYLSRTEPAVLGRIFVFAGIVGALITTAWAIWFVVRGKREYEEQLLQSDRLATIGKMSSQVAHEIRNPLSSISLNMELLRDEITALKEVDLREVNNLLDSINRELERLQVITGDYLGFYKLSQLKLEPTNLNQAVKNLLDFLRAEAEKSNIKIELYLGEKVGSIPLDRRQIETALLNVIKNAFEAMPQGGTLTVSTKTVTGRVEIAVKDTGHGMSKAIIKKLADPFFTTKAKGTGLGLPLTQQIIREHKGAITCESQVGKGTTFKIELPIVVG